MNVTNLDGEIGAGVPALPKPAIKGGLSAPI